MNDAQMFEAAFLGCAAVTTFILFGNIKKMRVTKSHCSIALGFVLNVTGLKVVNKKLMLVFKCVKVMLVRLPKAEQRLLVCPIRHVGKNA